MVRLQRLQARMLNAGRMTEPDFDAVVVGASVAGCTAARLFAQRGARVALVERRPDLDAYKTVCTHYIQPSATPTIERLGLAALIEEHGAVRNSIDLWTPYGGWIRHRGDAPYGYNVTRQVLDPLLRRHDRRDAGRGAAARLHRDGASGRRRRQSRRRGRGSPRRAPRAARAARRRRRRSRHARRADGRRQGPRTPAQPLLLLGLLARRASRPTTARGCGSWSPTAPTRSPTRTACCLVLAAPHRDRLPEFRDDLEGAYLRYIAALPDAPDLSRRDARVQAARQARPAERQPPGRAARPGLRRRRRARLRSALGRRLRMGLPERGVARRGDRRRARRRRGPRRGARRLPQASTAAGSGRTTSSSPTSPPRARPTRSSARCTAAP